MSIYLGERETAANDRLDWATTARLVHAKRQGRVVSGRNSSESVTNLNSGRCAGSPEVDEEWLREDDPVPAVEVDVSSSNRKRKHCSNRRVEGRNFCAF